MGTVAIACAAVDDVTGWCILAYIVVLIRSAHSSTSIWMTLAGLAVFVAGHDLWRAAPAGARFSNASTREG